MSINFDTSNETHQGPPDGTQGYLAAAIETSSIPSLHIFFSPNPESDRMSNRKPKKPNGPNRKSNRLTKKRNPHTLCHTELLLGLIDVLQGLHLLRTFVEE